MAQNFFGSLTSPSLPLLDANFSELYGYAKNLVSDGGGNVGIGTATPSTLGRLAVVGTASAVSIGVGGNVGGAVANELYITRTTAGVAAPGQNSWIQLFNTTDAKGIGLQAYQGGCIFWGYTGGWYERLRIEDGGAVRPGADNTQNLGVAGARWAVVYAGTGTINTSDARDKTAVQPMSPAEISAATQLAREIGTFQWLDAVAAKGQSARRHVGLTVQRAMEILQANQLDPLRYAFICHDAWDEVTKPAHMESVPTGLLGDDGTPLMKEVETKAAEVVPAGNRYGFRTDQLLMFIARGMEARLAALEARAA